MRLVTSIDDLPGDGARDLLGRDGFFSTPAWWRTVWAAGVPAGATPLFGVAGAAGTAVLFPLLRHPGGQFEALTNPYTCLYQPAAEEAANLRAAGQALGRLTRRTPFMRLDALDPGWPGLAPLLQGARAAGMVPLRFDHFGNWHELVAGRDWRAFLAARPGALRETTRRRLRDAERDPALSFTVVSDTAAVAPAIAEYEAVYARSWKEPEPFPDFNAELMRQSAAAGALRLGLLRRDGVAIAVQLWIMHAGTAAVLKLAHDEAFKPMSPGTVLTAFMIRHMLEVEQATSIDFGRGDDPYKQLWTSERRQRIGVLLANPLHPGGMAMLARHGLGRLRQVLRGSGRAA